MASPYTLDNDRTTAAQEKHHPQHTIMTPTSLTYYHQQPPLSLPQPISTMSTATAKMPLPFTTTTTTTKAVGPSIINTPTATIATAATMPPVLSSSYSSTHSYLSASSSFSTSTSLSSCSSTSVSPMPSSSYFTWLVFLEERWTPFDTDNQKKLEQTLSLGGTFVDITDTNFPHVKRVRVFPKTNYLSYLGVKYRLSRIMQPDAWLDHTY